MIWSWTSPIPAHPFSGCFPSMHLPLLPVPVQEAAADRLDSQRIITLRARRSSGTRCKTRGSQSQMSGSIQVSMRTKPVASVVIKPADAWSQQTNVVLRTEIYLVPGGFSAPNSSCAFLMASPSDHCRPRVPGPLCVNWWPVPNGR
jgi:hypothetical protein